MNKRKDKEGRLNFGVIQGVILLGAGSALMVNLWGKGILLTIPFILIGIGFYVQTKAIK
jgi:hypothetical protein